jgi:fucose 4-O-acetylase-like acetyltransferase
MTKRLFLLNGLAILAVVCSHAAGWGLITMFQWTNSCQPVSLPNYDPVCTLSYYLLIGTSRLGAFSVPAFLFVSGFFVAYAAQSNRSTLGWNVVLVRLRNLLIPYFIWSIVTFVGNAVLGITYTPFEYLEQLILGRAQAIYFFIPLLCQFYLLSPLLVPLAKAKWKVLLLASALVQAIVLGLRYLPLFELDIPALHPMTDLLFPMYGFFFTSGIVAGFHLQKLKEWLHNARWSLLGVTVILGGLAIVESEAIYRLTGIRRGAGPSTFPASLYSAAFIACFLAFYQTPIPRSRQVYYLGLSSFGIYLLHSKVLEFFAYSIRDSASWMFSYQVLFQPLLILVGIGVPLLFMIAISKSPIRKFYRYLFG